MRQTTAAVLRPPDPPHLPTSDDASTPVPGIRPWVLRLFFLSGLSGILFQVLWTRIFTYLLGGTTQSVSAVITAFMLGLGVGSYLFGRLVDGRARRPLLLYGVLELGVALSGLAAFYAFQHTGALYEALYTRAPQATVKWLVFLIAFVFISIPATLIGGTLPAIVRHAVTHAEGVKSALGRLYAINSLGSSAGAILMLGLVWGIGYEASYHVALLLNSITGVAALVMARREARGENTEARYPHPVPLPEGEGMSGGVSGGGAAGGGFLASPVRGLPRGSSCRPSRSPASARSPTRSSGSAPSTSSCWASWPPSPVSSPCTCWASASAASCSAAGVPPASVISGCSSSSSSSWDCSGSSPCPCCR